MGHGLHIVVAPLVVEHRLWCVGFNSCDLQALERGLVLKHRGLVALRHVQSSRTRDQTLVTCIGRQNLIHCATKDILEMNFNTSANQFS